MDAKQRIGMVGGTVAVALGGITGCGPGNNIHLQPEAQRIAHYANQHPDQVGELNADLKQVLTEDKLPLQAYKVQTDPQLIASGVRGLTDIKTFNGVSHVSLTDETEKAPFNAADRKILVEMAIEDKVNPPKDVGAASFYVADANKQRQEGTDLRLIPAAASEEASHEAALANKTAYTARDVDIANKLGPDGRAEVEHALRSISTVSERFHLPPPTVAYADQIQSLESLPGAKPPVPGPAR